MSDTQHLVIFSLHGEQYALPITTVQEIIRHTEPRSLAPDTPWLKGVINLRGKIIPVYDLAARLGLEGGPGSPGNIVIVESEGSVAGLVVDAVDQVLTVEYEQLDEMPSGAGSPIEAVAKLDERLIVLLDPAGVLGDLAATA